MNRTTHRDLVVFFLLVSAGAGLRLLCRDLPNFAPVAALALFAGYVFEQKRLAIAVPLATMTISDLFIGGYSWQMMILVYGMLALPALCGGPLRKYLDRSRSSWKPVAALLGCSLAASLAFFLVTNFGSWIWFETYPKSVPGLVACYTAALPFFRYTLGGDLLFAVTLFGTYCLATQTARKRAVALSA